MTNDEKADLQQFNCDFTDKECEAIRKFVVHDLAEDVLTFNAAGMHLFDQPTAALYLLGFLDYLNQYGYKPMETTHVEVSAEAENVYLFLNCKSTSIK